MEKLQEILNRLPMEPMSKYAFREMTKGRYSKEKAGSYGQTAYALLCMAPETHDPDNNPTDFFRTESLIWALADESHPLHTQAKEEVNKLLQEFHTVA